LFMYDRLLVAAYDHRMSHRLYLPGDTIDEVRMRGDKSFGRPGQLYGILAAGGHVLAAVESVRARMPSPTESARLCIPDGTPMLIMRRVVSEPDGRTFAMEESCVSADNSELVYELAMRRQ